MPNNETTIDCNQCGETVTTSYKCDSCGEWFCTDCWGNGREDMCESCYEPENETNRFTPREPQPLKEANPNPLGKLIKSKRGFGVEIECYYHGILVDFPKELGIHEDGSLNRNGVEYVTPVLRARQGERFITDICEKLNDNGYTVDATTGLHIHLDSPEFWAKTETESSWRIADRLKTLWAFYMVFDEVIRAMLPQGRREGRYCRPLKGEYSMADIKALDSIADIERKWYKVHRQTASAIKSEIEMHKGNHYDDSRYMGINFHSLLSEGHLEIRYHSGTLQAEKILHWTTLHLQILDAIADGKISFSQLMSAERKIVLTDKIKFMFELLKLDKATERYLWKRIKKFNPSLAEEGALKASKVR